MGVIIPAGFAQLTWAGFHGSTGQTWACTMGIDVVGTPDAQDVADAAYDAWFDNMLPVQTSSTAIVLARAKLGPNDLGPMAEHTQVEAGQVDVSTSPSNVAVLVKKQTAAGGRPNRGRFFVPGIAEGSVNNAGTIDGATLANWQTAVNGLQADLVTALFIDELVVHHDESSPVSTPTPITTLAVDSLIATQRRRLRR